MISPQANFLCNACIFSGRQNIFWQKTVSGPTTPRWVGFHDNQHVASSTSGAQLWQSCKPKLSHEKHGRVWLCETILMKCCCGQKVMAEVSARSSRFHNLVAAFLNSSRYGPPCMVFQLVQFSHSRNMASPKTFGFTEFLTLIMLSILSLVCLLFSMTSQVMCYNSRVASIHHLCILGVLTITASSSVSLTPARILVEQQKLMGQLLVLSTIQNLTAKWVTCITHLVYHGDTDLDHTVLQKIPHKIQVSSLHCNHQWSPPLLSWQKLVLQTLHAK